LIPETEGLYLLPPSESVLPPEGDVGKTNPTRVYLPCNSGMFLTW